MSKDNGFTRIGVILNDRQLARLTDFRERLGVPSSRFFAACADVLTDEELAGIMARFAPIKAKEAGEKMLVKLQIKVSG